MPLTPQEVASKVFGPTRMRRGYDENEVDAFLDSVEAELTRLNDENQRLRRQLQLAGHEVPSVETAAETDAANTPQPAETVGSVGKHAAPATPELAEAPAAAVAETPTALEKAPEPAPVPAAVEAPIEQRVTRMLVLAQQTADAAIREAETDADRTRGAARMEAERVLADARSRAAEEIGKLQRSKSVLEGEVERLQVFETEYRQRLRAYLTMQLTGLDEGAPIPVAVEGGGSHALEGSGPASGDSEAGLSDPPGFGPVWSPEGDPETQPGADPLNGETHGSGIQVDPSPFDTGSHGQRSGGYGSAS